MDEKELRKLQEQKSKAEWKVRSLERVLSDLFDAVENCVLALRVVLYIGSAAGAWFYLNDKVLAVAIVSSLTVAHLLIAAREYMQNKKKELTARDE